MLAYDAGLPQTNRSQSNAMDSRRRNVLQAGLAASSLFLPVPWALVRAQSDGASKLVRAPKFALVVGNAAYKNAPVLKNPANDARAMADALKGAGFEVTVKLDANRAELAAAIRAHAQALAAKQGVGLFYFAGHGLQLAWRNYLVPVEATVAKEADVARTCVDVASLFDGLTKAANPMNVIVLDACRENPFGRDFREVQRGLSQMDAPPTTLLAYATSPGNVASDGAGANGLYTEHLLREINVRSAKIEDVFKRVRLGVRRETRGAQVPWESTSLEEDFYFLPPAELREQSEAEREKDLQEQLLLWEAAKDTVDPAPLVAYLARYPSGDYSELAQLRLDRVLQAQGEKRVQAAPAEKNPFTKGTARIDTAYRLGDSYTYQRLDLETKAVQQTYTTSITGITDSQVIYDRGLVTDLLGNTQQLPDGRRFTDNQNVPVEFEVGRQWSTRYRVDTAGGQFVIIDATYRIVFREPLSVPAGTFNAFLIEGVGTTTTPKATIEGRFRQWWDPSRLRRPIVREELRRIALDGARPRVGRIRLGARPPEPAGGPARMRTLVAERHELMSFRQG